MSMFPEEKIVMKFPMNIRVCSGVDQAQTFVRAFTIKIFRLMSEFWDVIIFHYFLITV